MELAKNFHKNAIFICKLFIFYHERQLFMNWLSIFAAVQNKSFNIELQHNVKNWEV